MNIYLDLFLTFFKIGLFSFGGGYTMISVIQQEMLQKNWLDIATYSQIVTVSQMTPGPIAVNLATYVGAKVCNENIFTAFLGSFIATLGVGLPSFLLVLLVARSLQYFSSSRSVQWVLQGIRPAVIGLMFSAIIFFGKLSFLHPPANIHGLEKLSDLITFINPLGIAIAIAAFYLNYYKNLGVISLIILCGIVGVVLF